MADQTLIMMAEQKNLGLAFILTFFFGPLGMIYSTVKGAIIMIVVGGFVGLVTMGMGLAFVWPVSVVWGVMAANAHNKALAHRLTASA